MKILFFLGLLFFQEAFAIDLNFKRGSEHIEVLCTAQDLTVCNDLLEACEEMYKQLSLEFAYQLEDKIEVFVFPDIHTFHQAIHQEEARDWLIVTYGTPIQMTSPLRPGSYHSPENVIKALCKSIVHKFIYGKFPQSNAPWWLIAGVTASKTNWPYVTRPPALPNIEDLEAGSNKTPGLGWCALSIVSFIEKSYGAQAIDQLLEDYSSFEKTLGLTKEELILDWQASIQN